MIIIFTGNGKGKTTAALGQALRAIGNGSKVLIVQFVKGPWISGEHRSAEKFSPQMKIVRKGKGFVGIGNDKLPRETHKEAAILGLAYAEKEAQSKKWDILVLDEIWNAVSLELLSPENVSGFIDSNLSYLDHLIMTGRDCPKQFIDMADLVTEMREIKHPFARGIMGRQSVEF